MLIVPFIWAKYSKKVNKIKSAINNCIFTVCIRLSVQCITCTSIRQLYDKFALGAQ